MADCKFFVSGRSPMQRRCCVTLFQETVAFFFKQFIHFKEYIERFAWNMTCIVWIKIFWIELLCVFSERGKKLCKVSNRNMLVRLLVTPKLWMARKKRDFHEPSQDISSLFFFFFLFTFFVYLLRLWPCGTTFSWMNAFKQLVLNEKMQARGVRVGRLPRESSRIVAFKPSRVTRNSRSPCVFFNVGL